VLGTGERWEPVLARADLPLDPPPPTTSPKAATPPATSPPATSPKAATPPATSPPATSRPQALTTGQPARPAIKRPIELLFEEGWAALAAGDPRGAAGVFERAARSAPDDPLAEDAWFWRASSLAKAKSPAAPGALDQFLSRYPRSPRAGEASAVLGWLLLDADLDRAEALFRVAAADRVSAVRASGTKGLSAVAQKRANAR
jgi:TolA-binding protein